jgi:hypothetical protein
MGINYLYKTYRKHKAELLRCHFIHTQATNRLSYGTAYLITCEMSGSVCWLVKSVCQ